MDEPLISPAARALIGLLCRILPGEFCTRVVEPALDDLLAGRLVAKPRASNAAHVGVVTALCFAFLCLSTALRSWLVRPRGLPPVWWVLGLAAVVALALARARVDYGPARR